MGRQLEDVKSFLGSDWQDTRRLMESSLKSDIGLLNSTNAKLLEHGGKQLRPVLCLLIARSCNKGQTGPDTVKFAVASELLHNATLLHDDVADASDSRRGRPTINALMGPSISVLLGDYWLVRAVDNILSAQHSQEAISVFANTLLNLSEGEMLQLQKAGSGDTGMDDYLKIIFNKTASLFDVVAYSACLSVNASEKTTEKMRLYATDLGLAFQMRDDIFDYADGMDVGKPTGGIDILERKITLPLLGAFANAPQEEKKYRELISQEGDLGPYKEVILSFVRENGGVEYAQRILENYISEAVSALDVLEDSKEKEILVKIARYVGERKN